MSISYHSVCNILQMPDEILVEIILHLNARHRGSLANSCSKFHTLIFEDKRFFEDLDFSEDGYLTSSSDLHQYFENEEMYRHTTRINLSNTYCRNSRIIICDLIKATNLVELNLLGIDFKEPWILATFLKQLKNLRKLAVHWPQAIVFTFHDLIRSVSRLRHLTVRIDNYTLREMLPRLFNKSCMPEMEELVILSLTDGGSSFKVFVPLLDMRPILPPKLKIAAGYNFTNDWGSWEKVHRLMWPDDERWTQFCTHSFTNKGALYSEKDVDVPQNLNSNVRIKAESDIRSGRQHGLKFWIQPGYLFVDAVQAATEKQPIDFRCLAPRGFEYYQSVVLRIKDVKALLKNPKHQFSYLQLNHNIEQNCDVHLVLSVFPNLTKLDLCGVVERKITALVPKSTDIGEKSTASASRDEVLEKEVDFNPSFKKLVENTPRLKEFVLHCGQGEKIDTWDLAALIHISGWKKLTNLFLDRIPITNGEFLIEIGMQCENLEKLRLADLGSRETWCYKNELSQMLSYCSNLKDFSIEQDNIGKVSDIFLILAEVPKLRRLRVKSFSTGNDLENLSSSVETLIRSCRLILFVCEFEVLDLPNAPGDELISTLKRLKEELRRPSFEFEVINFYYDDEVCEMYSPDIDDLRFVHRDLLLPYDIINGIYLLSVDQ